MINAKSTNIIAGKNAHSTLYNSFGILLITKHNNIRNITKDDPVFSSNKINNDENKIICGSSTNKKYLLEMSTPNTEEQTVPKIIRTTKNTLYNLGSLIPDII